MKRTIKFLAVSLALALTVCGLSACSDSSQTTSQKPAKSQTPTAAVSSAAKTTGDFIVGFSNNNDLYPYCVKFREYLQKDAEKEGLKILVANAKGDTNVQNGQIDNFIVQNAQIVSAISNDLNGSVPALEAARAKDIPYISFLTSVKGGDDYNKYIYIGSQNYDAGLLQGQYLAKVLKKDAKILYMTGSPNDQQCIDRKKGFKEGLKSRTDVKILAELNSNNTKDKGVSITEDWMQAYDSFDAIIGQNDDSVLGAIEALKSSNRLKGVITVGIDGSDDALASIQKGEMTMSVLQDAKAQAEAGVSVMKQVRDGVDPATIKDVLVPFQAVSKDNVATYLNK